MKIYCFSGLGADERAFQFIDFSSHTIVHVKWIEAQTDETLENYAHRIGSIIDKSEPFILLGLSFGGMLCVEISKLLKPEKLLLLSTITCRDGMPLRMKIAGAFHVYNLIPAKYFNQPSKIAYQLFGVKTEEEKNLLDQIIRDSDPTFIKWALKAISKWKNTQIPSCYRIHGTQDRIFPYKLQNVEDTIKDGGHLMVISHAEEVSAAINSCISTINVNK